MSFWIAIAVAGLGTFATRYSFVALFGRVEVPTWLGNALTFVAPAVLAAIVVPAIMAPDGGVPSFNPRLLAGGVAALVAWRTRNAAATIGVGLPALWLLDWLF